MLVKEEEQFAWAAISVYHFRNVCQLRQRYFHAQNNRLINPRCLESLETLQQRRCANALCLDFRRQTSTPGDFHRRLTSAYTSESLRDS